MHTVQYIQSSNSRCGQTYSMLHLVQHLWFWSLERIHVTLWMNDRPEAVGLPQSDGWSLSHIKELSSNPILLATDISSSNKPS